MDADGENNVIGMPGRKPSLMSAISRAAAAQAAVPVAEPQEAKEPGESTLPPDDLTPLPNGSEYRAHARPDNKPVPTLRLLTADGQIRGFPFANLDSIDLLGDDAGKGLLIVLRFSGMANVEVRMTGRKLDTLYNYLGYHRIAWIRQLPKGKIAVDARATVIDGIEIKPVSAFPYPPPANSP